MTTKKTEPVQMSLFNDNKAERKAAVKEFEKIGYALLDHLDGEYGAVRSFSVFPSDQGGYVFLFKRYDIDGEAQQLFTNGFNALDAFKRGVRSLDMGWFKRDRRYYEENGRPPAKV